MKKLCMGLALAYSLTATPAFALADGLGTRCAMIDSRHKDSLNSMCWFYDHFPFRGWWW